METAIASITLFSLALAIILGIKTNINLGVISIALAFLTGHFLVGMPSAQIYIDGWPVKLFFMLMGMTLLFGIARINGTFTILARQISSFSFGNRKLMCLIIFVFCAFVSMVGVGTIITPAILMPLVVEIANEEDIPEWFALVIGTAGAIAGGMSPLAPTGIIGTTLAAKIGVTQYLPIFFICLITYTLETIFFFFAVIALGLKLKKSTVKPRAPFALNKAQLMTVFVVTAVIIGILLFKLDLGLTSFLGAGVLLILKAADEEKAVASISWVTLLLICGVSMLVNVIQVSGGIDLLASLLSKIMTPRTASPIINALGGLMSTVSSASGVVMPTLIPTIPGITEKLSGTVSPEILTAAVIVGAHSVVYSPLSTMGAIAMSAASEKADKQKMFTQFMLVAFISLLFTSAIFYLGIYNKFF